MFRQPRRPILLTGSHRSGSTWVGKMIASHPRIAYIEEPFNSHMRPDCPVRHMWHHVTDADAEQFRSYIGSLVEFWPSWGGPHHPRLREAAFQALLCHWRRLRGARPLLKDPIALFSAEWLASTFDMDVVVLIRHPIAIASSLKRLGWAFPFISFLVQPQLLKGPLAPFESEIRRLYETSVDVLEHAVLVWNIIHHTILEYRRRHPDWIFLRHEDLSLRPVEEYRALFARLGLDFSPQVRRTVETHTSAENAREAPAGEAHHLRRDSRQNVWNWTHRLRPEEIALVRKGTEELAREFYPEETWWLTPEEVRASA
jgi:hypothetical protein